MNRILRFDVADVSKVVRGEVRRVWEEAELRLSGAQLNSFAGKR